MMYIENSNASNVTIRTRRGISKSVRYNTNVQKLIWLNIKKIWEEIIHVLVY